MYKIQVKEILNYVINSNKHVGITTSSFCAYTEKYWLLDHKPY